MSADGKVFDLTAFRSRRLGVAGDCALYIYESGGWQSELHSSPSIHLVAAHCAESLSARLCDSLPEIILIESDISWADPIELIQELEERFEAPIVMLCSNAGKNKRLVKNAYSAGVSDVLYHGQADELEETLEVLLKFRRQIKSSI